MDKMLGYIFGSLGSTEKDIKNLKRLGAELTIVTLVGNACITIMAIKCKEYEKKISELENRMSKLEPPKEKDEKGD